MKEVVSQDEVLDKLVGKQETPERIQFENELNPLVIARQFKELRIRKKLTQTQLAKKIGMEKGQLSKIENGKFNLTVATINKIAAALDAKVSFDLQPV